MKTITKTFTESRARVVHQSGAVLDMDSAPVTIHLHTRDGETTPCCAELEAGELYAEIGLEFEGNTLTGYDGVFDCPEEVLSMIRELGFTINL